MKMTKKYMLYDSDEGYYDIYLFNEEVDTDKLKEVINELKNDYNKYWDLESISIEIKKRFDVKDIILFTLGEDDVDDIMKF